MEKIKFKMLKKSLKGVPFCFEMTQNIFFYLNTIDIKFDFLSWGLGAGLSIVYFITALCFGFVFFSNFIFALFARTWEDFGLILRMLAQQQLATIIIVNAPEKKCTGNND